MTKSVVLLFMVIGSTLGGYAPVLFGVESFSIWGVLGSAAGGLGGIWLAFQWFN
jgi:hypothetical protein